MNTELINIIALWVGYFAIGALAVCVIGGGYLCAYEICKAVGSRIFFPVWAWHIATTVAVIKSSKGTTAKSAYVQYLFHALREHEKKHPELRGLLKQYAQAIMSEEKEL